MQNNMSIDLWDTITDFVPDTRPLKGDFTDSLIHDSRLEATETRMKENTARLLVLGSVCRSWRCLVLPRIYRHVFIDGISKLEAFCHNLQDSEWYMDTGLDKESGHRGYGRWVQEMYWKFSADEDTPQRKEQDAMRTTVELCPNLVSFCPVFSRKNSIVISPSGMFPPATGASQLRSLQIMGNVKLRHLDRFHYLTNNLETLILGSLPLTGIDRINNTLMLLNNLRNLHILVEGFGSSYIRFFAHSQLHKLRSLSIQIYGSQSAPNVDFLPLFAVHGSKLKSLEFSSLGCDLRSGPNLPDITGVLYLCENVTIFGVDFAWLTSPMPRMTLVHFPRLKRFNVLGLLPYVKELDIDPTYNPKLGTAAAPSLPHQPIHPITTLIGVPKRLLTLDWCHYIAALFRRWLNSNAEFEDVNGDSVFGTCIA